jgi:hypothetical protein
VPVDPGESLDLSMDELCQVVGHAVVGAEESLAASKKDVRNAGEPVHGARSPATLS